MSFTSSSSRALALLVFCVTSAFASLVPVGFISYDVTNPGVAAQFDITNLTGPNSTGDSSFPVTTSVNLSSLQLVVSFSDGTSETVGSSYFSLAPDGLSFNGTPISIGSPNPQPTGATLTGALSPTSVTLFDGTTETLDPSFTAIISPSSGSNLQDGDLVEIDATTTTLSGTPEPQSWLLLFTIGLIACLARRRQLATLFRKLKPLLAFGALILIAVSALQAVVQVTQVKLTSWAVPSSGAPGSYVNITGSGFPTGHGTLAPSAMTISYALSCGASPVASNTASSITVIAGSTSRVHVLIPSSLSANNYFISLNGAAPDGTLYASGTSCSEVTVTQSQSGVPAAIAVSSGTPQSAAINTTFGAPLVAVVTDASSNPVPNVTVTFSAPTSGASGTFAGGVNTATTNSSGVATSAVFTANSLIGGYTVAASVAGVATPANFNLTNTVGPPATITATSGTPQSTAINMAFASPLVATVKDSGGNPISGVTVTFSAPTSGASGTFAGNVNTAATNAQGVATSASFTANGTAGGYTVTASAAGVSTPATFSLTNTSGSPAAITATSGTPQSATINTAFGAPLVATVKDSGGNPLSGITVTFSAPNTGASGTFAGGANTAATNSQGVATSAIFTANSTAGAYAVTATVAGLSSSASYSLTNNTGSPATITATSGTPQSAPISTAYGAPLVATVKDAGGNPVSGVTVTFNAPTSGASGAFAGGITTAATNTQGVATSPVFTANSTAGSFTVTASAPGVSTPASFSLNNTTGSPATITASSGTPQSATVNTAFSSALVALVKDSGGNPLSGITVTFSLPTTGASGTFAGNINTAVTNAQGLATSPVFTANSIAGSYSVLATVSGVSTAATFNLANNPGVPATVTATSGTPQSTTINTAFSAPLVATVKDSGGNPLNGITVTFSLPSSGATASFAGGANTAITNAQGVATSAVLTASSTAGGFTVVATVSGVSTGANFSLTNTVGVPATITATSGTPQSAAINSAFTGQLVATVKDAGGNPLSGITVTFAAPPTGASGSFAGGVNTAVTNAQGIATSVAFTANATAGSYSVLATVSGVSTPATFSLTNTAGTPTTITFVSGSPQSAIVNTAFTNPLVAKVTDVGGNPVANATVTFTAPTTGASGTFAGGVSTATTNALGVATSAVFTANATAGSYNVLASVAGVSTSATYSLTNTPGTPTTITAYSGTPQSATVGAAFANPLVAKVTDAGGNPVPNVTVTFNPPTTGPSGSFATTNTATTNAQGLATSTIFTANGSAGSYAVSASTPGATTNAAFSLTNTSGTPTNVTVYTGSAQSTIISTPFANPLVARVTDGGGNPVGNVVVTFTAPTTGASGTFAGGVATATTNAQGLATSAIFTANSTAGNYSVSASVAGVSTSASFSLTNTPGTPAAITAYSGSNQSAAINTAFGSPLIARVTDSGGNVLANITVTFTAPSSGASGTFAGGLTTATTNSQGLATSAIFTANATTGSYTVTAAVASLQSQANFALTNTQPSITQVQPTSGNQAQTLSVIVTGQNTHFVSGTTTAYFGTDITVNSVTVSSATSATVNITISPIAALNYHTVTLTTGSEVAVGTNAFLVNAGPAAITSLTPAQCAQGANCSIAVVGSNTHFQSSTTPVTTASFGANVGINSVVVTDATHATVNISVAANATLGAQTVTLTTGGEVASLVNGFSIVGGTPTITSVSPSTGNQGDPADTITINGQNTHWAQGSTTATFGSGITVTSLTVNSATNVTAVISIDPAALIGNRTITLTTGSEVVSSAANAFQVLAGVPSLTLNPNFGAQGTNPTVSLTGAFTNFTAGQTTVSFGSGISVGTLTVNGPTNASVPIQIGSGASLGGRTVTVTTGTQVVTATFSVTAGIPAITSITPNSGVPGASGLSVAISGNFTNWVNQTTVANFGPGISVGGAAAGAAGPVTVSSTGTLTASLSIAANATVGPRNVVITTGSEVETSNSGFTVLACSTTPPTWISNSPTSNATNVPLNQTIQVEFNAPIDRTTINTSDFILHDQTTGANIPATVSVDATGRIMTLTPSVLLSVGRQFYAEWGNLDGTHIPKDSCGNTLTTQYFYFTTTFSTETTGPSLLTASPISGDTNTPENTQVVLKFSAPINPLTWSTGITISSGGTTIPGTFSAAPATDYTQVTFVPGSTLSASTTYTVTYTSALQDGAGNGLVNPGSFNFTTGTSTLTTYGSTTSGNPYNQESGVGTNVTPTFYFNRIVDPITITTSNFRLVDNNTGYTVPVTVSVAGDRLSATITPLNPLQPGTLYYYSLAGGFLDLAGNYMYGNTFYFYTGAGSVTSAPTITSIAPPNGATGAPVNTVISAFASSVINPNSVGAGTITVTPNGSTTAVAGTVAVASDYQTITFTPTAALSTSTTYNVMVSGIQDPDGNAVPTFTSTFQTGTLSTAVTGSFGATSVTPANSATGVSNTSQIVITFSRNINPATVTNILVRDQSNNYYNLPGTWAVTNGDVATFTPTNPYPAGATIQVWTQDRVKDYAGNTDNAYVVTTFTVANTVDNTPFTVTAISPSNGASGIGRNATITLTFSKPVNQSTANATNAIQLFSGDTNISRGGLTFSADNRMVSFEQTTPASSTITVIATSAIQDLSGNSLAPFQSQYNTSADISPTGPTVISMRPANGASDISQTTLITLFTNGTSLNAATVPGALYVSQNGVLITGTIQLIGNNQAIQFTPSAPLAYGALIQVNLTSAAQDINGNSLTAFSGTFHVQANPATNVPTLLSSSPTNGATGIALNVIPQYEFDQALLPSTVNSNTVRLYDGCAGQAVPGTVSLTGANNNIIQFQPQNALTALCSNTARYYYFQMNDFSSTYVTNTSGVNAPGESFYFYVGTASDTSTATVIVTPYNGATGIGINGQIVLTFSKAINPISVNSSTVTLTAAGQTLLPSTITFNAGNTVAYITPQSPFPANSQVTVAINGITDPENNAVTPVTSQFTTGPGPDAVAPTVISASPTSNQTGVPTNTAITLVFSKPMATPTINSSDFYLHDQVTGLNIPGTISFSADLKTATLVPSANLSVDRQYYFIILSPAADLTGNTIQEFYYYFTTAPTPSSVIPQVTAVNPTSGLTNIPTNTVLELQFNEPIQPTSTYQITLTGGGQSIALTPSFDSTDMFLSLTPAALLLPNTQYTLSVTGILDNAGHSMAAPFTSTFTTGVSSDIANGSVTVADPYNYESGVGTNVTPTVYFNKLINPLSLISANAYFRLYNNYSGHLVQTTISVAANQLSATLTPTSPLQPNTFYYFQIGGFYDVTGNYMNGGTWYFYTGNGSVTTGPTVTSVNPPNGATAAPVNTQVSVIMSNLIDPATVNQSAITVKQGSTAVAGTVALASDYQTITFTPTMSLATSTTYSVTVGGFQDQDGNAAQAFSSTFTTGTLSTSVTGSFGATSVTPANGTTIASNTTPIVIVFSRNINPATVNNILVRDQSNGYYNIAGTWTVTNGNTATFVPTTPYPANSLIQVWTQDLVQDYAGNTDNAYVVTTFTSANSADTTAPTVTSVTPTNGATGVGTSPQVVLTFSKSINPATLNATNLPVFVGTTTVSESLTVSSNNRTVSIQLNNLPANSVVTVAATPNIKDLSGNALTNFQSQFTTGAIIPAQSSGPSVAYQLPSNGATDVPQNTVITLYIRNGPLNSSTVQNALHVSQNGALFAGTTTVNANGAIEFTPSSNFAYGATIQIYLDTTAQDVYGNPLTSAYTGQFTIQGNPASVAPLLTGESPANGATGIPLNVIPQYSFDQPLLASSVNATSVRVYDGCAGQAIAGTPSLVGTNIVQFVPQSPLISLCNGSARYYYFQMNDFGGFVTNTNGVNAPGESYYFYVGTASDTTVPTVIAAGPPNSATGVGVNATISLQFSKPINPISVNSTTVQITGGSQTVVPASISFNTSGTANTIATITPLAPLPANTQMTITVNGVTDVSGNVAPAFTSQFTTGAGPNVNTPTIVAESPAANDTIPTNTGAFTVEFSEQMDPLSVNSANMYLIDQTASSTAVAGTISASADGKTYTFTPSAALTAGHSLYLQVCRAWDLTGNPISGCPYWYYTVGSGTDTTAPTVTEVNPIAGLTNVPTNAAIQIEFSKEINTAMIGGIQLLSGGNPVAGTFSFTRANQIAVFTPSGLLSPNTTYTISVSGVEDVQGTAMTSTFTETFTTGTGVNLVLPTIVSITPANGATGVPDNSSIQVVWSEPMNPLSFDAATTYFKLELTSTSAVVPTTVSVSSDGKTVTLTPTSALTSGTNYKIFIYYYMSDVAGNLYEGNSQTTFTAQ